MDMFFYTSGIFDAGWNCEEYIKYTFCTYIYIGNICVYNIFSLLTIWFVVEDLLSRFVVELESENVYVS